MDRLQQLKDAMEKRPLKTVLIGGYSKDDVMLRLDTIYAMFEKILKEQKQREIDMLSEFEMQLRELREEFESTKEVSGVLINKLNRNINELNAQNERMDQAQKKIRDAYAELMVEKNSIEEAQTKIKQERDDLQSERERLVREQSDMKEAYRGYCKGLFKEYSESLCILSREFSRILENVSNIQKEIDEEKVFEGLEKAVEMVKREAIAGTVEEIVENAIEIEN